MYNVQTSDYLGILGPFLRLKYDAFKYIFFKDDHF
jgi:hypothetical protein